MIQSKQLPLLLATLVIGLFFLYPMADADLGWHLRYGETYLKTGNLHLPNTFSSVMPEYVWPNHSWGFDILAALLFHLGGFWVLSFAGAVVIAVSFYVVARRLRPVSLLVAAPVFIYFGQELLNIGFRSQLVSLLALVYLWSRLTAWKTKPRGPLWDVPVLFLVWANLHGEHILGLGVLWLFTAGFLSVPINRRDPSSRYLIMISLLSGLAIFANPFGVRLLQTTLAHFQNPLLVNIYEWMPWELNTPRMVLFLGYIGIFLWGVYRARPPLSRAHLLVYFALGVMAIRARRVIPFFLLLSLPLWSTFFVKAFPQIKKTSPKTAGVIFLLAACLIMFVVLPPRCLFTQTWDSYCKSQVLCSEPLVHFLSSSRLQGKILNSYRLGGHLIYRYPQLPVFIDGRMSLWETADHRYPFADYLEMVHAAPGGWELFTHNDFDYVILHPQFALTGVLQTAGWPIIYKDATVLVFENPHHNQAK